MVTTMFDDPIVWTPPSPLWGDSDHVAMQRPAILRFACDDFMEELQRMLARDPALLRGCIAVPETWRGIRKPARTANPNVGLAATFARMGVTSRRGSTQLTARSAASTDAEHLDLKLYQPAHQRFYLVGTSLVCQRPGLPDRKVDRANQERVAFVMRRWFPPREESTGRDLPDFDEHTWIEHAFVPRPDGNGFAWQPVADAGASEAERARLLADEERLPMFPLSYAEDDQRARRLLAGLIPVGKREAYHAALRLQGDGAIGADGRTKVTARKVLFRKQVAEPWKALVEQARRASNALAPSSPTKFEADYSSKIDAHEHERLLREARAAIQLGSWLVLADLASFLETYLPSVHAAIKSNVQTLPGTAGAVLAVLRSTTIAASLLGELTPKNPANNAAVAADLATALANFIKPAAVPPSALQKLESTTRPYKAPVEPKDNPLTENAEYPQFLFPLADPVHIGDAARPAVAQTETPDPADPGVPGYPPPPPPSDAFDDFKKYVDRFVTVVIRALDVDSTVPEPALPTAAEVPADMRDGWFHLRCVYERPECGPLHRDTVSAPSERFRLAGFFDPDAPARPIRIGLPIDTTPAGLRKFDKNTAFVMSDVLCGQVARMKGITFADLVLSILPWPFHKDLSAPDNGPCEAGMVCSLSIPIITLCALILLIIIVTLLDLIFHWLPFLMVCFPLPGFRAKKLSAP